MKLAILGLFTLFSANAEAKNMIRVIAIGASPKGQFIAFEEFGYLDGGKIPFSRIRVKNIWKDEYMNQPIKIVGEEEELELERVRAKAKQMARERLKEFNIST